MKPYSEFTLHSGLPAFLYSLFISPLPWLVFQNFVLFHVIGLFLSFFPFLSFKSPGSELLHTPTPPPLPFPRHVLSPEVQAITAEWISLTMGVSPSRTPVITPPLPPLPEGSACPIDYLTPSAAASPSPSESLHHSNLSGSSSPQFSVSPLLSFPFRPPSSARPFRHTTPQSEEKFGGCPSPNPCGCQSPLSVVGRPQRFLSELSDVIGNPPKVGNDREVSRNREREGWMEPDKGANPIPKIPVEGCLKPSNRNRRMSPEQRPLASFGESRLCQERITAGQGGNAEKRGTRKCELREIRSRANKVLLLHVCAVLKPCASLCAPLPPAQQAARSQELSSSLYGLQLASGC